VIAPSIAYMDRAYADARAHGFSREPIVEMLIPSTVDPSLAPPRHHVASLFIQHADPEADEATQARAADAALDAVEAHAPGFRATILHTQLLTPRGLEARFGLAAGDIFHGRMTLDQLWAARRCSATPTTARQSPASISAAPAPIPAAASPARRAATPPARSSPIGPGTRAWVAPPAWLAPRLLRRA
jgi:phytoene dehydrogenase-like protein